MVWNERNKWRLLVALMVAAALALTADRPEVSAEAAPVNAQEPPKPGEDTTTIDPFPQITGAIGGGARGTGISPTAFTDTLSFGELSPINTNPFVRIARRCTATTGGGIREIRLSVPSRTFADPEMLQYSDIGVGIQNVVRTGGGCFGTIVTAFHNDPSTSYTINPATGRASYPTSLANIVNPSGVMVLRLRPNSVIQFDVVFACVPSYYSPGSTSFVVTVGLWNSSPGNPCP
jgi:hypothetical protein